MIEALIIGAIASVVGSSLMVAAERHKWTRKADTSAPVNDRGTFYWVETAEKRMNDGEHCPNCGGPLVDHDPSGWICLHCV